MDVRQKLPRAFNSGELKKVNVRHFRWLECMFHRLSYYIELELGQMEHHGRLGRCSNPL